MANQAEQCVADGAMAPLAVPLGWPGFRLPDWPLVLRLPFLGEITLRCPHLSKHRALDAMVRERLKSRDCSFAEAWREYPELLRVAHELRTILGRELRGFEPMLMPEDSYALLGQWLTGDLCEVEAMMAIEDRFGFGLPNECDFATWTMLDLARFVDERRVR